MQGRIRSWVLPCPHSWTKPGNCTAPGLRSFREAAGSYQGWPQYCDGPEFKGYQCHANGGLCPFNNATSASFTQSNYDDCMVYANVTECQVDSDVFDALGPQFARCVLPHYGTKQRR